jgi:hypothetical protein
VERGGEDAVVSLDLGLESGFRGDEAGMDGDFIAGDFWEGVGGLEDGRSSFKSEIGSPRKLNGISLTDFIQWEQFIFIIGLWSDCRCRSYRWGRDAVAGHFI